MTAADFMARSATNDKKSSNSAGAVFPTTIGAGSYLSQMNSTNASEEAAPKDKATTGTGSYLDQMSSCVGSKLAIQSKK